MIIDISKLGTIINVLNYVLHILGLTNCTAAGKILEVPDEVRVPSTAKSTKEISGWVQKKLVIPLTNVDSSLIGLNV